MPLQAALAVISIQNQLFLTSLLFFKSPSISTSSHLKFSGAGQVQNEGLGRNEVASGSYMRPRITGAHTMWTEREARGSHPAPVRSEVHLLQSSNRKLRPRAERISSVRLSPCCAV